MNVDPVSQSPGAIAAQREVLVLRKHQDVARQVGQSLVDLIKSAPAPGRIDTYA